MLPISGDLSLLCRHLTVQAVVDHTRDVSQCREGCDVTKRSMRGQGPNDSAATGTPWPQEGT